MTRIKQTRSLFTLARHNDGKVDTKEAKKIARALRHGGVSAAESKGVTAQLRRHQDTFAPGAVAVLKQLVHPKGERTSAPAQKQTGSAAASAPPSSSVGDLKSQQNGGTIEDRTMDALSKSHEMKKAIIGNLPR